MRRFLVALWLLVPWPLHASEGLIETDRLIFVDESRGQLDADRFRQLATQTNRVLEQLLEFWSVERRVQEQGKIRVKFQPPRGGYYGAQYQWEHGPTGRDRTITVFGVRRAPQEIAHKLTHAICPSADKLVRNMMGIPTEARFGNPESFPMCSLDIDDWVLAFRDAGSYRPLSQLIPEHEPWGMAVGRDGLLIVTDERLQHISYAEAGSFGAYLLRRHGTAKMKRFYRVMNENRRRSWVEVFGRPLEALERDWIDHLESARPASRPPPACRR